MNIQEKNFFKSFKFIDRRMYKIFIIKILNTSGIVITAFMTIILSSINFTIGDIGLIMTIVGILYAPVSMVAAFFSDSRGRKQLFCIIKLISIASMCLSICFIHSKLLCIFLIVFVCCSNGLDPVITSTAIDFSKEEKRKEVFGFLQLCASIGMASISLMASYFFHIDIIILFSIIIVVDIISIIAMNGIYTESKIVVKKTINNKEKKQNRKLSFPVSKIKANRLLIIFSIILINFSILFSQQNYGLSIKLQDIYGKQASSILGILIFSYYLTIILFNLIVTKLTKNNSCIVNIVIGGAMYIICMVLVNISYNLEMLVVAMFFWAIANLIINTNNGVYIAEKSNENNRALFNSIFTTISGSGTVIGPLISSNIIKYFGSIVLWRVMIVIAVLGTILMATMHLIVENNRNKISKISSEVNLQND